MSGILRKLVKRLRHEIASPIREIVGLLRDRKDYLSQPSNEFTRQGYEVIPDFWDKDECDRLIQVANRYLGDRSYSIEGNCYLVCRKAVQKVDNKVQQIMNAQEIDAQLSKLFSSHIIEEMFEQRMGEKVRLQSITIQVDNLDTQTKRGFHNDNVTPPRYKAFIYLNDVEDYGDGPYTVIPSSHHHTFRKIVNHLYNRLMIYMPGDKTYLKGDMRLFYSNKQSVSIFGKAGTLILSTQQLAHKGWQQHDRNKRYVLSCYLTAEKHASDELFTLGQKAILQEA